MSAVATIEQWRSRVGRDKERLSKTLHDQVGQGLTAVGLELHLTGMDFGAQTPGLVERLAQVQEHLESSFAVIRDLSREYHPDPAGRFGVLAALEMLAGRFEKQYQGSFQSALELPPQGISDAVARAVYDAADCALDNVLRHARSSQAALRVEYSGGEVRLAVEDNGQGFEKTLVQPGTGTAIMDYHVRSTRATWVVRSGAGQGTLVQLAVKF